MAGRNLLADDAPVSSGRNLLADDAPEKESTAHKVGRRVLDYGVTPALEAGGALLGGTLGTAAAGPIGMVGGGALGYATGAEAAESLRQMTGLSAPKTLKENVSRAGGKLLTGAEMEMGGGIAGKALSAIPKAWRAGKEILAAKKGTEAKRLAEVLRTNIGGKTEDVIKASEAEKAAAKASGQRATEATQQLESGKTIAAARQAKRQQRVVASLNEIAPKGSRPTLSEDVGEIIQNQGTKNVKLLRQTRQTEAITKIKDPAFEGARAREKNGDTIASNENSAEQFRSVLNEARKQIRRAPRGFRDALRKRFSAIYSKGKYSKGKPLSLDQAEQLRRMLNDKNIATVEGYQALDVARMKQLSEKLRSAMEAYEPRLGEYLAKYKELSAPITRALGGRGEALTEVELQELEQQALYSADKASATSYYLNGSRERAQRLIDLVGGKTPELVNSMRRHFRTELESMSADQIAAFQKKNTGLLEVFSELSKPIERVRLAKAEAEQLAAAVAKSRPEAATRLGRQVTSSESAAGQAESVISQYSSDLNNIQAAAPEKVASVSKTLVDKMRRNNLIDDANHQQMLKTINAIEQQFGKTAKAKEQINLFWRKTLVYSGLGSLGVGAYYGKKLLED